MLGKFYQNYIKERSNLDVIESEYGFIIYRIDEDSIWIEDYYIAPEKRKSGEGTYLADRVFSLAIQLNKKKLFCQSDENANNHDISRKAILAYGFTELSQRRNGEKWVIQYVLDVQGE